MARSARPLGLESRYDRTTTKSTVSVIALAIAVAIVQPILAAFEPSISSASIERELTIARSADAERARFHRTYSADVDMPIVGSLVLARVEVITEFRRIELIAESHVALGDGFGRGGIADAEAALKPWRNKVALVAHLRFPFPTQSAMSSLPPINIRIYSDVLIVPLTTERPMTKGTGGIPINGSISAVFEAGAVPSRRVAVLVEMNGQILAQVPVDLGAIK